MRLRAPRVTRRHPQHAVRKVRTRGSRLGRQRGQSQRGSTGTSVELAGAHLFAEDVMDKKKKRRGSRPTQTAAARPRLEAAGNARIVTDSRRCMLERAEPRRPRRLQRLDHLLGHSEPWPAAANLLGTLPDDSLQHVGKLLPRKTPRDFNSAPQMHGACTQYELEGRAVRCAHSLPHC